MEKDAEETSQVVMPESEEKKLSVPEHALRNVASSAPPIKRGGVNIADGVDAVEPMELRDSVRSLSLNEMSPRPARRAPPTRREQRK